MPDEWEVFRDVKATMRPFDGTLHDAFTQMPAYVNISATVRSPCSNVPELANLQKWLFETHHSCLQHAHDHGPVRGVSCPLLRRRPWHYLAVGADGAVGVRKDGLVGHMKATYPMRFTEDGKALRPVRLHPGGAWPLNSLAKSDSLDISLYMWRMQVDGAPFACAYVLPAVRLGDIDCTIMII